MFREYFQLRGVGHSRRESLARAFDYSVATPLISLLPLGYLAQYEPNRKLPEIKAEEDLVSLERRIDKLDFQSIPDIVDLPLDTKPKRYTAEEERLLVFLHNCYTGPSNDAPFFSPEQTQRYEALLGKLPQKFAELLHAVEQGPDALNEYQKKKREAFQLKKKEWEARRNPTKTI